MFHNLSLFSFVTNRAKMESNTLELSQKGYRFLEVILDKIKLIKSTPCPSPPAECNEPRLVNTNINGNGGTDRF